MTRVDLSTIVAEIGTQQNIGDGELSNISLLW